MPRDVETLNGSCKPAFSSAQDDDSQQILPTVRICLFLKARDAGLGHWSYGTPEQAFELRHCLFEWEVLLFVRCSKGNQEEHHRGRCLLVRCTPLPSGPGTSQPLLFLGAGGTQQESLGTRFRKFGLASNRFVRVDREPEGAP